MILTGKIVEDGGAYKFVVSEVLNDENITYLNKILISNILISNIHLMNGKSNKQIKALCICNKNLKYFPENIVTFFPNLQRISITNCGIERLNKKSLAGLSKLTELIMIGNEISHLPDDLFEFAPQLEYISFYANNLQLIGSEVFKPLVNIQYANFLMNSEYDFRYRKHGTGVNLDDVNSLKKKNFTDSAIIFAIGARTNDDENLKPGNSGTRSILQMIIDNQHDEMMRNKSS